MAIKPLNSVAGFSIGETPSNIILANGDITTTNITTTGISNLNAVGNVRITGGSSGQVISTDGAGNLSFVTIGTASLNNGTSNITVLNSSNILFSVAGTSNVGVVTSTGINVSGYLNATGNITSGNANLGNAVTANFFIGSGNNLSNIQGANVSGTVANANYAAYAGNVTVASQGNITSLGTLTSLNVNATVNAISFASNVATGTAPLVVLSNTLVANLNADLLDGYQSATANTANTVVVRDANGNVAANFFIGDGSQLTGIGDAASIANGTSNVRIPTVNGNVTIGVSGNSNVVVVTGTGVNVSGTLNASGNANVGNLGTTGLITATGNVSGGNLTTTGLVSATGNVSGGNLTTTGVLTVSGTGVSSIAGNLDMTSNNIINLATPVNANDAATKQYVDDVAQGLHTHDSCAAATPDTLANITSGTITYNNGVSGVGANLTTTGTFNLIDGVNVQTAGTRILVKNEANSAHNGIYVWSNATVITRADDFDTPTEMAGGDFTFVNGGTLYDNTGWVMTDPVTTVGTSPVLWVQFSGAGTYTAGTGLTLTGSQFSISNTAVTAASYGNGDRVATFTVNSQGQLTAAANAVITANAANLTGTTLNSSIVTSSLTSVGTLGSLAVTGNVTAGNFVGTFANGNSSITIPAANGNINLTAAGGTTELVITDTGVNVSGTLNATGNANVGNLGTAQILATANITAPQIISNVTTGTAPFVVTSTTQVANLNVATAGSATTAGTVTTNAQPNITSVGTLSSLSVTGNVSTGNISGTNGNLTTANISGNLILGNSTVTTTVTWASVTTTSVTANQTIASISATGVTGVEYLVKGIDSTGSKYSVASVIAVTDGTNVDYSTYGTVQLGGYTGSLAVNVVGGQLRLQVTPASSNSTVWTTQYRLI